MKIISLSRQEMEKEKLSDLPKVEHETSRNWNQISQCLIL